VTPRAAAGRYAKALFDVALKEDDVKKVHDELGPFVELLRAHHGLAGVMANPAIPVDRKRALVNALITRVGITARPLAKLIVLLADHDRLALLTPLAAAYRDRLMDHQKIIRGEVTSAIPLTEEKLRQLQESLARATGRTVLLESRVDSAILGGIITRIGSTVYDGSVTTQLEKMRQALVESGM
jgi:F-type H+-transporting ATPase subunit delta